MTEPLLIELDPVLGDTRPLWDDWLAGSCKVLAISPADVPGDRGAAAEFLDGSQAGNWRALLERFASDRAPVYLRPNAEVSAALRRLAASGRRLGVFTDAPAELAAVALAQLGACRRLEAVEAGSGALDRLRGRLGGAGVVVRSRAELLGATAP